MGFNMYVFSVTIGVQNFRSFADFKSILQTKSFLESPDDRRQNRQTSLSCKEWYKKSTSHFTRTYVVFFRAWHRVLYMNIIIFVDHIFQFFLGLS